MYSKFIIYFVVQRIRNVVSQCAMTETTGCANGIPYNLATEFSCGREEEIYSRAEMGCCNNGFPFFRDDEFCCGTDYNKVYPMDSGECSLWSGDDDLAFGDCWDCSDSPTRERERWLDIINEPSLNADISSNLEVSAAKSPKIDTLSNGPYTPPCSGPTSDPSGAYGCLNTYPYSKSEYYICDKWLLDYNSFGCCDGVPFRSASQSCCYFDGVYVIKNSFKYCSCMSYKCAPSSTPTKIKKTRVPTRLPTSSAPTNTFQPTSSEPSQHPTISYSPTNPPIVKVNASSNSNNNYTILVGGIFVSSVIMIILGLFQRNASNLIAKRHEMAIENEKI
jgi:hypothetical protein